MVRVSLLESVDRISEVKRKTREAADAKVQDWQKQIKVGDCFRQSTDYGFDIYGEVLGGYEEEHLQNYRFCYCFSITCPVAKKINVHISMIDTLIDRETFETMEKELQKPTV